MILQSDFDCVERLSLYDLVAEDVAFLAKNLGDRHLHLRRRDLNDLFTRGVRIAYSGEVICNWISHFFVFVCWTGAGPWWS